MLSTHVYRFFVLPHSDRSTDEDSKIPKVEQTKGPTVKRRQKLGLIYWSLPRRSEVEIRFFLFGQHIFRLWTLKHIFLCVLQYLINVTFSSCSLFFPLLTGVKITMFNGSFELQKKTTVDDDWLKVCARSFNNFHFLSNQNRTAR